MNVLVHSVRLGTGQRIRHIGRSVFAALLAVLLLSAGVLAGRPVPAPTSTLVACATTVTSLDRTVAEGILAVLRARLSHDPRAPGASVAPLPRGCFRMHVPATPDGRDAALAAMAPGFLGWTDGGTKYLPPGSRVTLSCPITLPGCPADTLTIATDLGAHPRPIMSLVASGAELRQGSVRLIHARDGTYAVTFWFDREASSRWCRFTSTAHGRFLALVFDGRVLLNSRPVRVCGTDTWISPFRTRTDALAVFGPLAYQSYSPAPLPLRLWLRPGQPHADGPPNLASITDACRWTHPAAACNSPQTIRSAYGIQPLLDRGITGRGRTIVVVAPFGTSALPTVSPGRVRADLRAFDRLYGLPDPPLSLAAPFGGGISAFELNEVTVDVETAHMIAPGSAIVVLSANSVTAAAARSPASVAGLTVLGAVINTLAYAVDHNMGDVITQSFVFPEEGVPSRLRKGLHHVYEAARRRGITLIAGSGDCGAIGQNCVLRGAHQRAGVYLPAADQLVTAVGGTQLELADRAGTYLAETAWNDRGRKATSWTRYELVDGASGGGVSHAVPRPPYQDGIAAVGTHRGLPDVAFVADPWTGPGLVMRRKGRTFRVPEGGTSIGAPAWAGIVALADQYAGRRLGAINPALYRIARGPNYRRAFHDVEAGDNAVRIFAHSGKVIGMVRGFRAGPGWDAVTGLGTPRVDILVPLLARADRPGDGAGL